MSATALALRRQTPADQRLASRDTLSQTPGRFIAFVSLRAASNPCIAAGKVRHVSQSFEKRVRWKDGCAPFVRPGRRVPGTLSSRPRQKWPRERARGRQLYRWPFSRASCDTCVRSEREDCEASCGVVCCCSVDIKSLFFYFDDFCRASNISSTNLAFATFDLITSPCSASAFLAFLSSSLIAGS